MAGTEHVIDVTEATFGREVLEQSREVPVVVDFWAPWCGPCRVLGPLLEKLAAEARGAFILARLNVDDNPNLSVTYSVSGIPAVKAFRDGQVVAEFVGAQPEPRVRDFLRALAPTEADRALRQAASLLLTRHWAQAEAAFRQTLEAQPNHAGATLGLARSLLAQGLGCEAQQVLEHFPAGNEVVTAEKLKPLARLLCEVEELGEDVEESDLDALYHQAARLLGRGLFEAGMDGLLDVLRQDKRYRRGEPRQVMLAVFELLGEDDPATREYRGELASVLY